MWRHGSAFPGLQRPYDSWQVGSGGLVGAAGGLLTGLCKPVAGLVRAACGVALPADAQRKLRPLCALLLPGLGIEDLKFAT